MFSWRLVSTTNPGDLVVMCVDKHSMVVAELEERTKHAQAGARIGAAAAATRATRGDAARGNAPKYYTI